MTSTQKNWNDLPNIIDMNVISSIDEKCMLEIQNVLERHGLTSKFGVALLHKHFDLEEDEMLLETNDPNERILLTKPVKVNEIDVSNTMTTIWRFDNGKRYGCSSCTKDHH